MRRRTLFIRLRSHAIVAAAIPLLWLHRLAFWLDERLFCGLKEVSVGRPLFVVGLPRSGTTLLHRTLAQQSDTFTAMPLWELILAPALCEKYALRGLRRADGYLGSPLLRLVRWIERRFSGPTQSVHATSLWSPEEDFLGLLPFGGCFLRVLADPYSERIWSLVGCSVAARREQQRLLTFYRGLIVRHLKFRGEHLNLISKNPSFTPWVETLREEFPDARFVGLRRDAARSFPSQLSSLRVGFGYFGYDSCDPEIVHRFLGMYADFWRLLNRYADDIPVDQFLLGSYAVLADETYNFADALMVRFAYQPTKADRHRLLRACRKSSGYRSRHRYQLSDYGLTAHEVRTAVHGDPPGAELALPNRGDASRQTPVTAGS